MMIIGHLADAADGASLGELSASLRAPKSSLLVLLKSLTSLDFIMRDQDRYFLGPAMFGLAAAVLARGRFPDAARQVMRRLWEQTGETVILAVMKAGESAVLYVDQIESSNPVRFTATIGTVRPLYCSAAGRVLLAFQPEPWREHYLRTTEFKRFTVHSVVDPDEIRRRIDHARRDFFAQSIEEVTDGGAGFAAPIFDRSGHIMAALLIAPTANRALQKGAWYRDSVIEAADEIARAMGGRPIAALRQKDG